MSKGVVRNLIEMEGVWVAFIRILYNSLWQKKQCIITFQLKQQIMRL